MIIPKRIQNLILNALQGGVVPRTGLGYIAVGREKEITALLKDLEIISEGGSTFRFVLGDYGSGKTFLLQAIKEHALAKGFIVGDVDLSPSRNLIGSLQNKKGLETYRVLMGNVSTKTSATGGALEIILGNWIFSQVQKSSKKFANCEDSEHLIKNDVDLYINDVLNSVRLKPHGFYFANIIESYWKATLSNNVVMKNNCIKWLRGEFNSIAAVKKEFGLSEIINDDNWFEYVKLFSFLFKKLGYNGFVIMIDEMINLYRCRRYDTRQKNYEKMLQMYNDSLQGKVDNLGIIFAGTPLSLEDETRGVFSYEALHSRLKFGQYNNEEYLNLMSPIIKIRPLSKTEIIVLLEKVAEIHSSVHGYELMLTEKEIISFVNLIISTYFYSPRYLLRDFLDVLNILYQNRNLSMEAILKDYTVTSDPGEDISDVDD